MFIVLCVNHCPALLKLDVLLGTVLHNSSRKNSSLLFPWYIRSIFILCLRVHVNIHSLSLLLSAWSSEESVFDTLISFVTVLQWSTWSITCTFVVSGSIQAQLFVRDIYFCFVLRCAGACLVLISTQDLNLLDGAEDAIIIDQELFFWSEVFESTFVLVRTPTLNMLEEQIHTAHPMVVKKS